MKCLMQKLTKRSRRLLLCCLGLLFCLAISVIESPGIYGQTPSSAALIQQGVKLFYSGQYSQAIQTWKTGRDLAQKNGETAQEMLALENLARGYQQIGQFQLALTSWQTLSSYYQSQSRQIEWGRSLTEQAQIYQQLGQLSRAIELLCGDSIPCEPDSSLLTAERGGDRLGQIAALGTLGTVAVQQGDYDQARQWLKNGLAIIEKETQANNTEDSFESFSIGFWYGLGDIDARQARRNRQRASYLQDLGYRNQADSLTNIAAEQKRKAQIAFKKSLETAEQLKEPTEQLRSLLALISSGTQSQQDMLRSKAFKLTNHLSPSFANVLLLLELAQKLSQGFQDVLASPACPETTALSQSESNSMQVLQHAIAIAKTLNDDRSISYAYGALGHSYE